MSILLPCPCCGGKAEHKIREVPNLIWVDDPGMDEGPFQPKIQQVRNWSRYEKIECTNCGLNIMKLKYKDAELAWNARTSE